MVTEIEKAEAWGMIESSYGSKGGTGPGRLIQVTSVGDAFIQYFETKKQE